MKEFSISPNQQFITVHEDGNVYEFNASCGRMIEDMNEHIKTNYPECDKALDEKYKDAFQGKFLKVKRFIKCNFSISDHIPDIADCDTYTLEFVSCPMRGECKHENVICNPKFNTSLSAREVEVTKCVCLNLSEVQMADKLSISVNTVHNHLRNIRQKTGAKDMAALVTWAITNNVNKL